MTRASRSPSPRPDAPYRYVIVNGTATVSDTEDIAQLVHAMALNYKGADEGLPYAEQILSRMNFVVITVTPSKISGWSE